MRFLALYAALLVSVNAIAETPAGHLWSELQAKREMLAGFHQEFDVSRTLKTTHGSQSSRHQVILDAAPGKWRESAASGSGDRIRIFDGTNLFSMDEGGDEYVRGKHKSQRGRGSRRRPTRCARDWPKATEVGRQPCGIPGQDHLCVTLDAPMQRGTQFTSTVEKTNVCKESREWCWTPRPAC